MQVQDSSGQPVAYFPGLIKRRDRELLRAIRSGRRRSVRRATRRLIDVHVRAGNVVLRTKEGAPVA